MSQRKRKRIEEVFGWVKTVGMLRKTRHRGTGNSRLGIHVHRYGLQPCANAESDVAGISACISPRRTASLGFQKGRFGSVSPYAELLCETPGSF